MRPPKVAPPGGVVPFLIAFRGRGEAIRFGLATVCVGESDGAAGAGGVGRDGADGGACPLTFFGVSENGDISKRGFMGKGELDMYTKLLTFRNNH
jgi:hypothetical protein